MSNLRLCSVHCEQIGVFNRQTKENCSCDARLMLRLACVDMAAEVLFYALWLHGRYRRLWLTGPKGEIVRKIHRPRNKGA
jgi:hypothetical protein